MDGSVSIRESIVDYDKHIEYFVGDKQDNLIVSVCSTLFSDHKELSMTAQLHQVVTGHLRESCHTYTPSKK